ncbi:MAG: hypothetical protein KTR14_11010 [Vampirovibrio sp.]|nr:hypothetical protein [Vampirovibrio sp.]
MGQVSLTITPQTAQQPAFQQANGQPPFISEEAWQYLANSGLLNQQAVQYQPQQMVDYQTYMQPGVGHTISNIIGKGLNAVIENPVESFLWGAGLLFGAKAYAAASVLKLAGLGIIGGAAYQTEPGKELLHTGYSFLGNTATHIGQNSKLINAVFGPSTTNIQPQEAASNSQLEAKA